MQSPTQTTGSPPRFFFPNELIPSLKRHVLHVATQSLVPVSRFRLFSCWSRVVAGRLFANKQLLHAKPPKLSIHLFQKLHPYTTPILSVVRVTQLLHVAVSYLGIYLSCPWGFYSLWGVCDLDYFTSMVERAPSLTRVW
jgi:hypothetical protein